MATRAYHAWSSAGRPWRKARPVAELEAYARANQIPVLGTLGNEAHLQAAWPEDHTPYSFTAWPVPLPGYVVCAIDLGNVKSIGAAILRDARAGRCPWLKYINVAGYSYAYADGFKAGWPNPDQHAHLSTFSDWVDRSIGPYDPLGAAVTSPHVEYTLTHITMPNGDVVAQHAAMTVAMAQLAQLTAATAADEARDKATLAAIQALQVGGTNTDTAAVITAVNRVRDEARAEFARLHAENADLKAANTGLAAQLAAYRKATADAARAEADKLAAGA